MRKSHRRLSGTAITGCVRDITSANKAPATHADRHAKGGADPITPESIGAAPGGYGSGDYGQMLTADDDLNTLTVGGHYLFFGNSIPQNAPTGLNDWTAYVIENLPYNEIVTVQILHIIVPELTPGYGKYSNCSLRRTRYGNIYTPWAWINPPMALGVEYMTTEHHLGKPVYVKVVDCGKCPESGFKEIKFDTSNVARPIRCYGTWTYDAQSTIPFETTGSDRMVVGIIGRLIRITTGGNDFSRYTCTVTVYYTKATD